MTDVQLTIATPAIFHMYNVMPRAWNFLMSQVWWLVYGLMVLRSVARLRFPTTPVQEVAS